MKFQLIFLAVAGGKIKDQHQKTSNIWKPIIDFWLSKKVLIPLEAYINKQPGVLYEGLKITRRRINLYFIDSACLKCLQYVRVFMKHRNETNVSYILLIFDDFFTTL